MVITWTTTGGFTNAAQATTGEPNGSFNANFIDITSPAHIIILGSGDVTNSFVENGGVTNLPPQFYRV